MLFHVSYLGMLVFPYIKKFTCLPTLLLLSVANSWVGADELTFSSDSGSRALIELYTSEGCNSCPPAEEFLNGLVGDDALWSTYIPVAFHVDYWDYLGWHDPYSDPAHGKRQSHYARYLKQNTVYTPAFMVNGKPWRCGLFDCSLPKDRLAGGRLELKLDGTALAAKYTPVLDKDRDLILHVAVLGMGLKNRITAGENRGRNARHEFVVLGYKAQAALDGHWETELPDLHFAGATQFALAVWVSHGQNPVPLQAVGGVLPQSVARQLLDTNRLLH
jgi:hypothetical protein